MKKVICTVSNDLSFDQRMIRICGSLTANQYEVLLVGRRLKASEPLQKKSFEQKRLNLIFQKGPLFYMELNIRLFFFLLFQPFDIINSVDLDTLPAGFMAARIKGKKCVLDAHEYYTEVPELVNRHLVKKIWEFIGAGLIPKVDRAYTVNKSLTELHSKRYNKAFSSIRNVPYLKEWIEPRQNQEQIILYQGALNMGRGLKEMILCMHHLKKYKLWLVGEGDLSYYLRDLIKNESLEDKVELLGRVSPEKLSEITKQAWIGINLLENKGKSYYYSLANRTFDFIHARLPAIHMSFPEYKKINEEFEIAVLIDDLDNLSILEGIQKLEDKTYHSKLRLNCSNASRILNWELEEKLLLEVYEDL